MKRKPNFEQLPRISTRSFKRPGYSNKNPWKSVEKSSRNDFKKSSRSFKNPPKTPKNHQNSPKISQKNPSRSLRNSPENHEIFKIRPKAQKILHNPSEFFEILQKPTRNVTKFPGFSKKKSQKSFKNPPKTQKSSRLV